MKEYKVKGFLSLTKRNDGFFSFHNTATGLEYFNLSEDGLKYLHTALHVILCPSANSRKEGE